ncbi:MAG TPA: DUF4446 family protein [Patescibacteria group bacterium]|nr:DUF4446 family protein [Patescibacteria group bacterium]
MTTENILYANLGLSLLLLIVVIWQFFRIQKLDSVRRHFYSQGMKRNLEFLMAEHDEELKKLNAAAVDLNNQTESLRTSNEKNFQRMGFVRYSQFGEAGNLSFSLAVLNNHLNGFVITVLHSRGESRVYSKEIQAGKSRVKLTDEETKALSEAANG